MFTSCLPGLRNDRSCHLRPKNHLAESARKLYSNQDWQRKLARIAKSALCCECAVAKVPLQSLWSCKNMQELNMRKTGLFRYQNNFDQLIRQLIFEGVFDEGMWGATCVGVCLNVHGPIYAATWPINLFCFTFCICFTLVGVQWKAKPGRNEEKHWASSTDVIASMHFVQMGRFFGCRCLDAASCRRRYLQVVGLGLWRCSFSQISDQTQHAWWDHVRLHQKPFEWNDCGTTFWKSNAHLL